MYVVRWGLKWAIKNQRREHEVEKRGDQGGGGSYGGVVA